MNIIEEIINSTDITGLLRELSVLLDECGRPANDISILCDCLVQAVNTKVSNFIDESSGHDNNYYIFDTSESPLLLLHSYLYGAESSEEVLQSISEFICNCSGIEEADCTNECEDIQNSEMVVVDLCEQKCKFECCVSDEGVLLLLAVSNENAYMPYFVWNNGGINIVFKQLPKKYVFDKLYSVISWMRIYNVAMIPQIYFIKDTRKKETNRISWYYVRKIMQLYMQFLTRIKLE